MQTPNTATTRTSTKIGVTVETDGPYLLETNGNFLETLTISNNNKTSKVVTITSPMTPREATRSTVITNLVGTSTGISTPDTSALSQTLTMPAGATVKLDVTSTFNAVSVPFVTETRFYTITVGGVAEEVVGKTVALGTAAATQEPLFQPRSRNNIGMWLALTEMSAPDTQRVIDWLEANNDLWDLVKVADPTVAAGGATFTQTYSVTDTTVPAGTAAAVVATASALSSYGYTQAQADALITSHNLLVAEVLQLRKLIGAIIDVLQAKGIAA